MLKCVFFDMDGTLLPMDEKVFTEGYFRFLLKKVYPYGYTDAKLLIDTIWKGTYMMYANDGKKNNMDVFWGYFASVYGQDKLKDIALFDDFYSHEFCEAKGFCDENPLAKEIVKFCREKVGKVILSTNPIFPMVGQRTRMSFIGLEEKDFDYVTSYENSSYCKPNPMYFRTLLDMFQLKPEECILFGNNDHEDGDCASSLGIKTYLVNGYVIHSDKCHATYDTIDMKDVIPTIIKEMELRK